MSPGARATTSRGLPRAIWALGLTSLFMDISSELVHGLLPLFLVVNLGASATALGLIEGIAEATAQITRVFSGWLSDALGKRKAYRRAGYALAAATKPLFPLANSIGLGAVRAFRRPDRQGHPHRAARCADRRYDARSRRKARRSACVNRSIRSGATIGPLAAIGLMYLFNDDIRAVLWFAVIPAIIAVLVLVFGVSERACRKQERPKRRSNGRRSAQLGAAYWLVVGAGDDIHAGAVQRGLSGHPRAWMRGWRSPGRRR